MYGPVDLRHDMMAAALRHFGAHQFEHMRRFHEKIRRRVDNESPRVRVPDAQDPQVNARGLERGLGAQGILVVVAVVLCGRPEMDDGVVSTELGLEMVPRDDHNSSDGPGQ